MTNGFPPSDPTSDLPRIVLAGIVVFVLLCAWRTSSKFLFFVTTFLIAILIALFLPKIQGAKEAARRSQCKSNMRDLGVAIDQWAQHNGRLPDSVVKQQDGAMTSWRILMLPWVHKQALFNAYDRSIPWDASGNLKLAKTNSEVYSCPSNFNQKDRHGRFKTAYAMVFGPESAFPGGTGLALEDFADGRANTILLGEAAGQNIVWTEPRDIELERHTVGINLPGSEPTASPSYFSSYHLGGAYTLFADGSVKFLTQTIDPGVLEALTTVAGGEPVDNAF